MRPLKLVRDLTTIRRQLKHLGLWEPITLSKARTPRAPPSTVRWILDAHDGTVIDLETERSANWMPTAPRYKRECIIDDRPKWPKSGGKDNSSTTTPQANQLLDDGLLLEIEDPDPWAQDNEPVFWVD